MNRKNGSTFLFFALLFVIICSAILPVFSSQNNMSISSYGTINYSGFPSPLPTPTPTPTPPSGQGEVFLWAEIWLQKGGQPTSDAQRIVAAKNAYGNPTWVEAGNWGGGGEGNITPHLTSTIINYLHSAGIKVSCRLWAAGAGRHPKVSLNDIKHSMDPTYPYGGSVDYQMSIGPEIDMFMFDESVYYSIEEMQDLTNYVHSLGKEIAMNPGGRNFPAEWGSNMCEFIDRISVEFDWRGFIADRQSLIQQYPNKFIGVSQTGWVPPTYYTVDLNQAVADTLEAWNGGVYYFDSRDDHHYLPDWWENSLSQLSGG